MASPSVGVLIQNTERSWTITLGSDGVLDLTTATAATLHVHRVPPGASPTETIEDWVATLGTATADSVVMTVPMLGATPGPNAVTVAGESLRVRPIVECSGVSVEFGDTVTRVNQLGIVVVER